MPLPPVVFLLDWPAYAGITCLTPAMRLAAEKAGADSDGNSYAGFGRPDDVGHVDSTKFPIRVHYRQSADANRAKSVVLPAAEDAWEIEVVEMGWQAPPPDGSSGGDDKFDVYMTNEGTFGGAYAFGFGPDVIGGDEFYSVPSFIALDDRWISDKDMLVFVSHELNHACQYATDGSEPTGFVWESTAEAMSDLVDDDDDIYFLELGDFQQYPFESLLFNSSRPEITQYDSYSYYEYGGMLFGTFIEERYGKNKNGKQLRDLWTAMAPQGDDFVDALATMDPENPSAAAVYTEFALWRMFASSQDDGHHFEEAADWPTKAIPWVEQELDLSDLDDFSDKPSIPPYDLGTSYYHVDLHKGSDQVLHVKVNGDEGAQWGIAWAVWPDRGEAVTGTVVGKVGDTVEADIPLVDGVEAEFGVVNAGPKNLRNDPNMVVARSFKVTTTLEDPPAPADTGTGDVAGDPTENPAPAGCACDGVGPASTYWPTLNGGTWGAGLVGLLVVRRRQKV
jgi:hypothetical protein